MYLNVNILFCLGVIVNGFIFPSLVLRCREQIIKLNMNNQRTYPMSKQYHEQYLNRLGSKNLTQPSYPYFRKTKRGDYFKKVKEEEEDEDDDEDEYDEDDEFDMDNEEFEAFNRLLNGNTQANNSSEPSTPGIRIFLNKKLFDKAFSNMEDDEDGEERDIFGRRIRSTLPEKDKKSENFEVITKSPLNFSDVGGYDNIKRELEQCVDLLSNYKKYAGYNVRVPKGLIFEGPPGNGKTLLAKALSGEAKTGFIAVSGSQFQEKYVGVGSSRIRELFELAKKNIPCIIFIDEIDALGRKRSGDGETSGSERDSTLNELLVALDGFKNTSGVFIIGATNRVDLLDEALIRPGRIDKRIYIGNPDEKTRRAIINIHIKGKPYDNTVDIEKLVESTQGLSGAQLENLLNEAMLSALRQNHKKFTNVDIDEVLNKMMVGWQPNEHQFTSDIIDHIAIHELGHAVVGLLSKHHAKMTKVVINLSAPKSPAYTIFESSNSNILTREALFEHLMILLSGRVAEEVIYGVSVTTGAINDFEEALKLAQRMICYYGMGKLAIYPSMSEKYKEKIDSEVAKLIKDAYAYSDFLIRNSKELILEGSELLKKQKVVKSEEILALMKEKHQHVFELKL